MEFRAFAPLQRSLSRVTLRGAGVLTLTLVACSGSGGQSPSTVDATSRAHSGSQVRGARWVDTTGPIPVPSSGAYLGAWVNVNGQSEEANIESLEQTISPVRSLNLHLHYDGFAVVFPSGPSNGQNEDPLYGDYYHGRAPVVSWGCQTQPGHTNELNAIVNGYDDGLIDAEAAALKGYPGRLFVRWFWEMNISTTEGSQGWANGNNCFQNVTGNLPTAFINAWRYIHDRFAADGVTNVTWLWNPNIDETGGTNYDAFYPGSNYVDWIGADGYDKVGRKGTLAGVFGNFLSDPAISNSGKPVMLGETGACSGAPSPDTQDHYLDDLETQLPLKPYAQEVRALNYFDAPGKYCGQNGYGTYELEPGAGLGLATFDGLASKNFDNGYFAPPQINAP